MIAQFPSPSAPPLMPILFPSPPAPRGEMPKAEGGTPEQPETKR